jgi:hypothetical protein
VKVSIYGNQGFRSEISRQGAHKEKQLYTKQVPASNSANNAGRRFARYSVKVEKSRNSSVNFSICGQLLKADKMYTQYITSIRLSYACISKVCIETKERYEIKLIIIGTEEKGEDADEKKSNINIENWDNVVGTSTGYELDDRPRGRISSPSRSRSFSSPCCPARLWGPPNLLSNWYWGYLPGSKAVGA